MNADKTEIKPNRTMLLMTVMFTGVLLIVSTYAWLSAALNVKVKFFDMVVSSDSGLFISLDGVEYSDTIEISLDSIIYDLYDAYPTHTNQWASGGLWTVSSNGLGDLHDDKFSVFVGNIRHYRDDDGNKIYYLNTELIDENKPDVWNSYISFDIFLKNVSGSPKPDNLFLSDDTFVDFERDVDEETMDSMQNVMDSIRFGLVKIASVSSKTDVATVQGLTCNQFCSAIIYEPNSLSHSGISIVKADSFGITLVDGEYAPTYAIIADGRYLEHKNGHEGTGIPLDEEHFAEQETVTDFVAPIFSIPNGVTKLRAYVWIEGQDIDSLETTSKGAPITISIDLEKDLAGYEVE